MKPKVIDAPEILQVIDEIPHVAELINGLYSCQYRLLMSSLVEIMQVLQADRYFAPHARYYWREVRVLAYQQFLESYMSVSLESMALTFGVRPDYLDTDLASFISIGRLSCSIDKVNGIVSSTRPDTKNAQYQATIKQGDLPQPRAEAVEGDQPVKRCRWYFLSSRAPWTGACVWTVELDENLRATMAKVAWTANEKDN